MHRRFLRSIIPELLGARVPSPALSAKRELFNVWSESAYERFAEEGARVHTIK